MRLDSYNDFILKESIVYIVPPLLRKLLAYHTSFAENLIIPEYECKFHRNYKIEECLISISVLLKRFSVSDNSFCGRFPKRKYACVVKKKKSYLSKY